ncbi:MAG TPA: 30S ribosomal protein S6e [Candidatus Thermoplasmatota archaeon]|nr:30S ribosomal protein S6e [Candidatus Thermoplasmatota archaeon]
MVDFKVVVSDPRDGKSYQLAVTGQHANVLVRKKIGDEVDGMFLGLPGYKVKITGGSDRDGFPMRTEIHAAGRKRVLVASSPGYQPKDYPGKREKVSLRGGEISPEIVQINTKCIAFGPKPIAELVPAAPAKK